MAPSFRSGIALAAGGLACVIAATTFPGAAAIAADASARASAPTGIHARAGELYDVTARRRLWGREQYTKLPMASITKVMTALVVIRAGDLDRPITITAADVAYVQGGASNAGLRAGDVLTTAQLLYAMLLPSGADAARALAESYGPGWPAFVTKMNRLAARLGLRGTHYSNFDGLPWPTATSDHSTARNLLILGKDAMAEKQFRAVVATRTYSVRAGKHHHAYHWTNTNLLLRSYPGVIGIKTGWTPVAGECLLFEATRGKRTIIGVVLHSADNPDWTSFRDANSLLNWAFGIHQPPPAGRRPAGTARE